jgi:hypothetical protein
MFYKELDDRQVYSIPYKCAFCLKNLDIEVNKTTILQESSKFTADQWADPEELQNLKEEGERGSGIITLKRIVDAVADIVEHK